MTLGDEERFRELVETARSALSKAYAPRSQFPVGSAVLTEDGTVFAGCNVENASYGATICAERTALVKAVSEGYTRFRAIAVISGKMHECWPCGMCRQFLSEFGLDVDVVVERSDGSLQTSTLGELLPHSFVLAE